MGKLLVIILIALVLGIIWALPLYICANLVLLLFHIPFHLTIFQAIAICLLASVIRSLLFKDKGE